MKIINKFKGEVFKNFGFTLVEMLVVISIIAILTSVLAGGYVNSQKSSRDAARKMQLKSISDALNSFYADNNRFPMSTGTTGITNLISIQGQLDDGKGMIYIKKMPKETKTGMKEIKYLVSSPSGRSFWLFTNLENPEDKSCYPGGCGSAYVISEGCCYVITSSNIGISRAQSLPTP